MEDGDFLDLDWIKRDKKKLIILSHGMEGSSDRYYMKRSALYFIEHGFDILAWNNRGCSGELNRLPVLPHHGSTIDIDLVIEHALKNDYEKIILLGFSMGGSNVSKYLSQEKEIDKRIAGGIAYSVSCDMQDSTKALNHTINWVYHKKFLDKLKLKVELILRAHPGILANDIVSDIKTFPEFHEKVTIILEGFNSVEDYYYNSSVNNFLPTLKRPLLMVNALNDPILGPKCHPFSLSEEIPNLHFHPTRHGGHLGFNYVKKPYSYMEVVAEQFINEILLK